MTEHPAASATLSLEEERDFDRFVTGLGRRAAQQGLYPGNQFAR